MTAATLTRAGLGSAPVLLSYRFELAKLFSQWRVRVLIAGCWIAPGVFVGVVSRQSFLPADTVFGRWMNSTGWSGALVVLAFACLWALPLLISLICGDVFAVEDRLGTWRHLLLAVRSPARIFAAKVLASVSVVIVLMLGLAVSAPLGGLISVGNRPLVGLTGQPLDPGAVAGRDLLAWACVLAPALAFAGVGILGSVALGRSPMGLALPALLALALNLVQLLPIPVELRLALPGQGFDAWRGLFTEPIQSGPIVIGVLVGLGWAAVSLAGAYWLFTHRDFADLADDGSARRLLLGGLVPLVALTAVSTVLIAVATPARGTGIDREKLQSSLARSYAHLYRRQARDLNRPAVTEAQLATGATCDKGGSLVRDEGPGTDWRCIVTWHLPGASAVGSAVYQLDVTADGRYVADGDGPTEVNGFFQVRAPYGMAPNPLWQFDGSLDLSAPLTPGN